MLIVGKKNTKIEKDNFIIARDICKRYSKKYKYNPFDKNNIDENTSRTNPECPLLYYKACHIVNSYRKTLSTLNTKTNINGYNCVEQFYLNQIVLLTRLGFSPIKREAGSVINFIYNESHKIRLCRTSRLVIERFSLYSRLGSSFRSMFIIHQTDSLEFVKVVLHKKSPLYLGYSKNPLVTTLCTETEKGLTRLMERTEDCVCKAIVSISLKK